MFFVQTPPPYETDKASRKQGKQKLYTNFTFSAVGVVFAKEASNVAKERLARRAGLKEHIPFLTGCPFKKGMWKSQL